MEAIDKQAKRILKIFGNDNVKRVAATVGPSRNFSKL